MNNEDSFSSTVIVVLSILLCAAIVTAFGLSSSTPSELACRQDPVVRQARADASHAFWHQIGRIAIHEAIGAAVGGAIGGKRGAQAGAVASGTSAALSDSEGVSEKDAAVHKALADCQRHDRAAVSK